MELVSDLLRLRRAERLATPQLRAEITPVREHLEALVGPTIGRARAARLLGLSQTALDRWIVRDDVAAVVTPRGRREVPLCELLGLLEEMWPHHADGASRRTLADVVHDRRRRAAALASPPPARHARTAADAASLAYHRLVAARLDPQMVETARERVRRWRADGTLHQRWADSWDRLLSAPFPRLARAIAADTPGGCSLRQTSPFAGLLTQQERRRLRQVVREPASA